MSKLGNFIRAFRDTANTPPVRHSGHETADAIKSISNGIGEQQVPASILNVASKSDGN